MKSGWKFYFPQISMKELERHRSLILQKSGLLEQDYQELFSSIISYIDFIPQEILNQHLEEAKTIIGHIDEDDVVFIALALSVENDGVWTDDTHFQKQNNVKVLKTEEIINLI